MTTAPAIREHPINPETGLTRPLSASLDLQSLARHRGEVAVELEVLAKKYDRFGWYRDAGTHAHDRLLIDWMDALQDFPLTEVQKACRAWVRTEPRKMPNEGDILRLVLRDRQLRARKPAPERKPKSERISKDRAAEIMQEVGFKPRRFGGAE